MEFGKCENRIFVKFLYVFGEFKLIKHALCLLKFNWTIKTKPEKNIKWGKKQNLGKNKTHFIAPEFQNWFWMSLNQSNKL